MIVTDGHAELLAAVCRELETELYPDYSGRPKFGRRCVGVVFRGPIVSFVWGFCRLVGEADPELADHMAFEAVGPMTLDSTPPCTGRRCRCRRWADPRQPRTTEATGRLRAARRRPAAGRPGPAGNLPLSTAAASVARARVDIVRAAAGGRFDGLTLNTFLLHAEVTTDRRAAAERWLDGVRSGSAAFAAAFTFDADIGVDELLESPHFAFGTVMGIADHLHRWRETMVFSCYVVYPTCSTPSPRCSNCL